MDVVIVGGGLIGLASAWRLAQHGCKVSVWDAARTGSEASWAGAGMLAPGGEMEERTWWGDLALRSLQMYPEFVSELQEESGVAIDYRECGALESAGTELEWGRLLARASKQREWGIWSEIRGVRTLFYPGDAAVNPRDLLKALRIACTRRGIVWREEQPVNGIRVEKSKVVEPEVADAVVLAAGAWSSAIPIWVEGQEIAVEPSFPVRGHLVSFAAGPAKPGPILRQGHTYILERANGVVIAGSTTEQVGYLREPDPVQFTDVEIRARTLKPELEGRALVSSWIGFRPGTHSGEPQLQRLPNTPVYLAYGHYRNGILMAPATADWIARAVTSSSQTDLAATSAHPQ